MSTTTEPPAELFDLAFAALPDWIEPAKRQTMALDVLDALQPHLDARLRPGGNFPPEEMPAEAPQSESERLLRIDPEHLVVIEPEELPALFAAHYPALAARSAELLERCKQWQADHTSPKGGLIDIADDAENATLADFIVQLDDHAREVDESRKRVKLPVYNAGLQIDGWGRTLAEPVMDIRGVTRTVSGKRYLPGPGTMQFAQSKYLTDKAERERLERVRIAKEAQAEADRKAAEARQAAQEEAARAAALQRTGLDAEDAQALAEVATDRAAEAADLAQAHSSLVGSYASEPARDVVRQHTPTGTTIGLRETWDFDEDQVDIKALCRGVIDGTVPTTFVTVVPQAIRQAIKARINPLRQCPGLVIRPVASAARRGAR